MDYIALNVAWIVANGVLAVLYKTIISQLFGSRQLQKIGKLSIPFLKTLDKMDARRLIAIAIFVIFTIITIKKYSREKEESKDIIGLIITIILGLAQMYLMCTVNF